MNVAINGLGRIPKRSASLSSPIRRFHPRKCDNRDRYGRRCENGDIIYKESRTPKASKNSISLINRYPSRR